MVIMILERKFGVSVCALQEKWVFPKLLLEATLFILTHTK